MALVKKCVHGRGLKGKRKMDAWHACGCTWTADLSIAGHRTYWPLGTDYNRARREHARLAADLTHGVVPRREQEDATFTAVADRYWAVAITGLAPNTRGGYESSLHHARRHLGPMDVRSIEPADLDDMEAALLRSGYASGTVKLVRTVTRQVMKRAVAERLLTAAPSATLDHPSTLDEPFALAPETVEAVLAGLTGVLERLTRFTYLTGLRPGEAIAVDHADVHGAVVQVHRNRIQRTGEIGPTKGRMRRNVDLSPTAAACIPTGGTGRVFPLDYRTWLRYWHDALVEAGEEKHGLHTLRHSNVALRLIAAQPITYIARQLGHSSASFTLRRYGRWVPSEKDDAAALDRVVARSLRAIPAARSR